jgi:hypothetical protein
MKHCVINFLSQPTKILGQCESTQCVGWVTQVTHTKCAITPIRSPLWRRCLLLVDLLNLDSFVPRHSPPVLLISFVLQHI